MEKIDPAKAQRVWQRVQSTAPGTAREQGLSELIAQEWTNAATYLQLSRRIQGRSATLLRTVHQQEMANVACLKGIYTLITGSRPAVKAVPPAPKDPETALRHCYGQEMQCLAAYESRSSDLEYGSVYARLAEQKREHCRLVLEILGDLKKVN